MGIRISPRAVVADIRSGLTDHDLMDKLGLCSSDQLRGIFSMLVDKGLITESELSAREPRDDSFDLTTREGMTDAVDMLGGLGEFALMMPGIVVMSYINKWVKSARERKSKIELQRETAVKLMKAGKEQRLSGMKITVDQAVGLDLGVEGIPVKCKIASSGHMTIEVTY